MKIRFRVGGMTCAACSARVEKVASAVEGVRQVEVNLLKGTLTVEAESENVSAEVIRVVQKAGYQAALENGETAAKRVDTSQTDALKEMKLRLVLSTAFLLILMYFTMGHMLSLPMPSWYHGTQNAVVAALLQLVLTLPVVYLNRNYYIRGFRALCHRSPNMDSLIAVGSSAALLYGLGALFRMAYAMGHDQWQTVAHYSQNLYFESAAMILTLITFGKFLETRAKGQTGDAIRKLMDLNPKTAVVLRDGEQSVVPVEEVRVGDLVVVKSGSSIAVDGTIVEGRGSVDQSALTGESVPVEKGIGDTVAAATVNAEGYFVLRADKVGEDTTLNQIIRMVEQAGASKAPIARFADRVAGVFVPVVMGIALLAFIVWMIAGAGLEFSLSVGISVLVISCPCALGLATPVAIMVGTGRGASMGVLFKNAVSLENLGKADTVVLDKTGTLTSGKPQVTDVMPVGVDAGELLAVAVTLEERSEHPFARAILQHCKNSTPYSIENFETLPGFGVRGQIAGTQCYGGSKKLMEQLGVSVEDFTQLRHQGKTPLYFVRGERYLGAVAVADVLKPDSAAAVKVMQSMGMDVVMLTGDNELTAHAVAETAGIQHVICDVLPAEKADKIRQLQEKGQHVVMVGDGINDAPALTVADVGIAIGAGTDIAIESADVVLTSSALKDVCAAVQLSRGTLKNIRQNLFWAFFYNCLGIPIAAGVLYPFFGLLLSPMLGAAAMSMSSVFVVTNALRLRFFRPTVISEETNITINEQPQEETEMETTILVEGMMCPHCKARVESVCKAAAGVTDAVVDLQAKNVTVKGNVDIAALKQAIKDAGYEVIG